TRIGSAVLRVCLSYFFNILNLDESFTVSQTRRRSSRHRLNRFTQQLCKRICHAAYRNCTELPIFGELEAAEGDPAQYVRLLQYRREHRREITGRGVDDLQYLGGRGLLPQGFARLGDQPRVLHCNDRLRGEVLQQRDLFICKGTDLPTVERHVAE